MTVLPAACQVKPWPPPLGVLARKTKYPFEAWLPGLLQAYWQYHLKAAKSDLHCRMRQRLTALRQQLALTRYDGL